MKIQSHTFLRRQHGDDGYHRFGAIMVAKIDACYCVSSSFCHPCDKFSADRATGLCTQKIINVINDLPSTVRDCYMLFCYGSGHAARPYAKKYFDTATGAELAAYLRVPSHMSDVAWLVTEITGFASTSENVLDPFLKRPLKRVISDLMKDCDILEASLGANNG